MKKERLKTEADPESTEQAHRRGKTRLTAASYNPAQPLLASARRSLQQPKRSRKSSEHGVYPML